MTSGGLSEKKCLPCEGGVTPLGPEQAERLLRELDGWKLAGDSIQKTYRFKDYHQTIAFVNATAWVSHREGHHPDLEVGYERCSIRYTTHAIGGLSENDFICAAKIDRLFEF